MCRYTLRLKNIIFFFLLIQKYANVHKTHVLKQLRFNGLYIDSKSVSVYKIDVDC